MSKDYKKTEENQKKAEDNQVCSCGEHGDGHKTECKESCGGCPIKEQGSITLSKKELEILMELKEYIYLPIVEFVMCSSLNHHISFTALAPVYIEKIDDNMEKVKKLGAIFKELENKRLISLDYDIPLKGFDYSIYKESDIYKYFLECVEEGKDNPDFLCDTAEIEFGSIALTPLGKRAVGSITIEK